MSPSKELYRPESLHPPVDKVTLVVLSSINTSVKPECNYFTAVDNVAKLDFFKIG